MTVPHPNNPSGCVVMAIPSVAFAHPTKSDHPESGGQVFVGQGVGAGVGKGVGATVHPSPTTPIQSAFMQQTERSEKKSPP